MPNVSVKLKKNSIYAVSAKLELCFCACVGHVDAGKSTLMGHLLYLLGNVNNENHA